MGKPRPTILRIGRISSADRTLSVLVAAAVASVTLELWGGLYVPLSRTPLISSWTRVSMTDGHLHYTDIHLRARAPSCVQGQSSPRASPTMDTKDYTRTCCCSPMRVNHSSHPSSQHYPPSQEQIRSDQTTGINTERLDQFLRFKAHMKVWNSGKSNIFLDFM